MINGTKKWISGGQIADLFLIVTQCDNRPTAVLIEKETEGFHIEPLQDMLGFRAAMLAKINMKDCIVPKINLLGPVGFGFSHIVGTALDLGRYCIGCGCVGLIQACLDSMLDYASNRKQFEGPLRNHQLIQKMVAETVVSLRAAREMYRSVAKIRDSSDPDSILETAMLKYFASKCASKAASDAVQIHGANGCSSSYSVERYFRDSKIMEIIEGSSQIQEIIIAKSSFLNHLRNN